MLNVHWQPYHRQGESDRAWFAELAPRFLKVVWMGLPPYAEDVPACSTYLYRDYEVEALHRGLLNTKPEELGRIHAEASRAASLHLIARGIPVERQLFESMNEPHLWAEEPPAKLARYLVTFLQGLHSYGLSGVVGNLGVGWPNNSGPDTPPVWDWFQPVYEQMRPGDYLGAHEYWDASGPRENWGWWAGRVLKCPFNVPMLITECQIDHGVAVAGSLDSWLNIWPDLSQDQAAVRLTDELWEYMILMREDCRVQGIFPYTYDSAKAQGGHAKWGFFEQNISSLKTAIRNKIASAGMPQPKVFTWGSAVVVPDPAPVPVNNPALGVDVSTYQKGDVRWDELVDAGYAFMFARATSGLGLDSEIFRHWNQSENVGLLRGIYHFLSSSYGGRQQARFFHAIWKSLLPDLPAVVDIERSTLSPQQVRDFLTRWTELTTAPLMVYTSKSAWERIVGKKAAWAAGFPLWVAHYDVDSPDLPDIWSRHEFWQTGVREGPGYGSAIDRDVFNGTAAELRARYGSGQVQPAPGPTPEPETGITITYTPGAAYLIGDYPQAGVDISLHDSWGNYQNTVTGNKREYGPGGFLFNTYALTTYTLRAGGQQWSVPMKAGQTAWLKWQ